MKLVWLLVLVLVRDCMAGRYLQCNLNKPLVAKGDIFGCIIPWLVSLRSSKNEHFCAGSLIAPRIVLTAAHCLKYGIPSTVDIGRVERVGDDGSGFETRKPVRGIMHEDYNVDIMENNDIALLILDRPSDQQLATIAPTDLCFETLRGCEVLLLGWGLSSEGGTRSDILLGAYTRSIRSSICKADFFAIAGRNLLSDSMICAGDAESDTCIYDSGGPLVLKSQVVGIVSWGSAICGDPKIPGVYTSIPRLRSWLNAKLAELSISL